MKYTYNPKDGNKIIDTFVNGGEVDDLFYTLPYHESWDSLMMVIRKIKQHVFSEGYDMFMPEHSSYISIGNACYDADLTGAWLACVKWIILRGDLQDSERINKEYEKLESSEIVYKSYSHKGILHFKISPHAIRRWKQRICETDTIDAICERFNKKELKDAYEKQGDGRYYIGNGLVVTIDKFLIVTVFKAPIEEDKIYQWIAPLNQPNPETTRTSFIHEFRKTKDETNN